MTSAVRPRAWDSTPAGRRGQGVLLSVAALFAAPALVATFLRLVPPTDDATALVASFIAYGILGYAVALLLVLVALLRARRRRVLGGLTLLVALLLALHASWLAPFFVPDDRPATTKAFTLMSLNLYKGGADSAAVVAQAQRADVVILIEATPEGLRGLKPLGWDTMFPYSVGDLTDIVSDTAIYSKFPLSNGTLLGQTSFQQWQTAVQVPELGTVQLLAVHPCNPYCGGNRWASEHAELRRRVDPLLGGPVVVAGDFNATDDHGPMQQLRSDGLRSGADLTGAGWMPTYPANRSFPPLLPIDHVLVSQRLTVTSIESFAVPGTDHRGLLASIAGTG